MQPSQAERLLNVVGLALIVAGCLAVLWPFLSALIWALILASTTRPLLGTLDRVVGGRRLWSVLILTLAIVVVLLMPFAIVALSVARNAAELTTAAQNLLAQGLPDAPQWLRTVPFVGERAFSYWGELAGDKSQLLAELKRLIPPLRDFMLAAGGLVGRGVIELSLSIFLAFFVLLHVEAIGGRFNATFGRIAGPRGERLLALAGGTVNGVVYGILGTALAQGVLAGIGFAIAGVPGALLLGLATFFLSVVPVGPPLIWIPAALWLFYHEATGWAIFVVLWGALVVSTVDNVLKPLIISRGASLPFVLVLLGILGGVIAFGFIGVFIGPTLLAVGYCLLEEWAAKPAVKEGVESDSVQEPGHAD